MNIKEAKDQIKNAMSAYFTKDEFGNYLIPIERQRPVFLMGAPGIGKTAVMEQVAQELGVGLVSYSITHHTRQSALGLPFIVHKTYGGKEYEVSEYTMSEIIANVYDKMEATGIKEGILFLDEINCVSETLAPAMLQFLQYKIFGAHRVPQGWIVVTAGNPPEYNKSVREFDIVTWDRLKRIDVEPDFNAWKEYAYKKAVHPSVLTYLEIKKDNFYHVETSVDGKNFVTARGWDDLSTMIKLYEKRGIAVDSLLIGQYIQDKNIAKDFSYYYDLFNKYKSDYQVDKILIGNETKDILERAKAAKFDERLSLLGMLLDAVTAQLRYSLLSEQNLKNLMSVLSHIKVELNSGAAEPSELVDQHISAQKQLLENGKQAGNLSEEKQSGLIKTIAILNEQKALVYTETDGAKAFNIIKADFDKRIAQMRKDAKEAKEHLENVFKFCEEAFGEGQELLILVTELTASYYGSAFISRYGCDAYFRHNKELLFYERQKEIISEITEMEL